MSGLDEAAKIRARQDKVARSDARKVRMAREEAREEAAREAKRAEQRRLVDEAKVAREAGLMVAPKPAPARRGVAGSGQGGDVSAVIGRIERRQASAEREQEAVGRARGANRPVLGHRTVDDPLEAGAKLTATVNLAEHPLEMMLSRRRLSEPLYEAGARFRRIYEAAEIGPGRGIDPAHIKVDGGRVGDPLSDCVVHAQFELKRLSLELGPIGEKVVSAVAGRGVTVSDLAMRWPGTEDVRTKRDYLTMRLKEALDHLATAVWGATGPERGRLVGLRDMGSGEFDAQAVAVANQTHLRKRGISL